MSSEQAVRGAVQTHSKRVWRFALALSGAPDVADDLVQATCLRALERHHQVTSHERLDSWLMTICRSIWLNEVRSRSVRRAQALSVTPEGGFWLQSGRIQKRIFSRLKCLPK